MCASRLDCHTTTGSFQRAFSFSLRCCATLRSSGSDPASGGTCKIRTCDLYPFRLSDGFHPVPGSACPRLSGVSAPWPLEQNTLLFGWSQFSSMACRPVSSRTSRLTYQAGCRMEGATLSRGICTPASAGVEEEIEEANGSAGAYAPTLPLSHNSYFVRTICCENKKFFHNIMKG